MSVRVRVCGWWFSATPPRSPFLFLFNVTGLAHMTLSSYVGTARARAASPAGALELDLQDKKKKTFTRPDRHLSPPPPFLPSSFIQSTPLLICSPWWEEIYQDAVSLTSLSDWDRDRISKCLTGLCRFIFKPPPPPPPPCTSPMPFQERGGGGAGGWFMEYTCVMRWPSTWEVLFTSKEIPDCFSSLFCSEPLAHTDLQLQNKYPCFCSKDELRLYQPIEVLWLREGWCLWACVLTGWWWPAGSQQDLWFTKVNTIVHSPKSNCTVKPALAWELSAIYCKSTQKDLSACKYSSTLPQIRRRPPRFK